MTTRWERQIPCTDGLGRASTVTVAVEDGRVVVIAPPGGAIVIAPNTAALELRAVLAEAAVQANSTAP